MPPCRRCLKTSNFDNGAEMFARTAKQIHQTTAKAGGVFARGNWDIDARVSVGEGWE